MNRKVRAERKYEVENSYGESKSIKSMKNYLRNLENESIRGLLKKSSVVYSNKSEGKLAKEINFSDGC